MATFSEDFYAGRLLIGCHIVVGFTLFVYNSQITNEFQFLKVHATFPETIMLRVGKKGVKQL